MSTLASKEKVKQIFALERKAEMIIIRGIMGFPVESISSSEDIREMARFYEANRVEVKPDLSDN